MTTYLIVAGILAASAIPVLFECLWDLFNPQESYWNKRSAGLWILVCLTLCIAWPVLVLMVIYAGAESWRKAT